MNIIPRKIFLYFVKSIDFLDNNLDIYFGNYSLYLYIKSIFTKIIYKIKMHLLKVNNLLKTYSLYMNNLIMYQLMIYEYLQN